MNKQTIQNDCKIYVESSLSDPWISAVVPVHNMGRNGYLVACLDSFAGQDAAYVEYVLVDDASTDDSLDIALRFARSRKNTTVVGMKENKRQGAARNRGITIARGRYVAFVDADDFVMPGYFASMQKVMESTDADAVINEWMLDVSSEGEPLGERRHNAPDPGIFGIIDKEKLRTLILSHWQFGAYKASLFDDPANLFPEGMAYEDTPTALRWYFQLGRVETAPDAVYCYRQNPESTVHTTGTSSRLLCDRLKSSDMIIDNAVELGVYDEYRDEIDEYFMRVYLFNTLGMLMGGSRGTIRDIGRHARQRVPGYLHNPYHAGANARRKLAQGMMYRCPRLAVSLLRGWNKLHNLRR